MAVMEQGIPILGKQPDVVGLTAHEMMIMAGFHDVAHKCGFAVTCQRCNEAIRGDNTGHERIWVARCGCREYRADMGAARST